MKFFDFHSDRSRRGDGGMIAFAGSSRRNRDASGNRANSRVKRDDVGVGLAFADVATWLTTC